MAASEDRDAEDMLSEKCREAKCVDGLLADMRLFFTLVIMCERNISDSSREGSSCLVVKLKN